MLGNDLVITYTIGFIVVNNIHSEIDFNKIPTAYFKL
jgi:hypothetical protein